MTHTRREVTSLLDEYGIQPSRSLGQNFVADPNTVRKVAHLADLKAGDHVVEIGPGLGSLSLALLEHDISLTCIELDHRLMPLLHSSLEPKGVRVLQGDALKFDWSLLAEDLSWIMVANLPYNIATPLIANVLDDVPHVSRMLVMVQREVGERLVAGVGDDAYGAISVKVSYWATAKLMGRVPPTVFVPKPNIESVLISIERRPEPLVPPETAPPAELFELVRAGFAHRRKMLRRALDGIVSPEAFEQAGVLPSQRAEELDAAAWGRLAECRRKLLTQS